MGGGINPFGGGFGQLIVWRLVWLVHSANKNRKYSISSKVCQYKWLLYWINDMFEGANQNTKRFVF
jgi:hypothetical protein